MKTNKKIRYTFLVLFTIVLSSCTKDLLDKEPNGLNSFWNTGADAELGINAAYTPLYEEEGFGEGQFWYQAAGDDFTINNAGERSDINLTNFATTTNASGYAYARWQIFYRVIRRANDVLRNVPDIDMDEAMKNRILGEANFMLGFAYFELAKWYGGLPFYDINDPDNINQPRQTKTETFNRIEQYLLTATTQLPDWIYTGDNVGRAHLGAAWGYLAKLYAYWGKWEESKAASDRVINSGAYALQEEYANLFSLDHEKSSEVLFGLVCAPVRHQTTITPIICLSKTLTGGAGWAYFAPTKSLADAFEENDSRRKATLAGIGETVRLLGQDIVLSADNINDMETGYMCVKFMQPYWNSNAYPWDAGLDNAILRLSDIYLLNAEAIMMLNGGGPQQAEVPIAAAANSLNMVRLRAFNGDQSKRIDAPTFNDLMRERRCELAYEGDRHLDLKRWNLAQNTYRQATTATDPRGPRQFDPIVNASFPLPQTELDNSNGILRNNPLPTYSDFE
jgi:hypothetical protein